VSVFVQLRRLEGRFAFMARPGPWLWGVALLGGMLRMALAAFSAGTLDVVVWEGHAREIAERGLMAYYHGGQYTFNHPPLMGWLASAGWSLADATGIPFRLLLRTPTALLDAGTAALLVLALGRCTSEALRRARYALGAAYWLSPLAIIFSAHHGNTDSAVAFFVLAATLCIAAERPLLAGALLGASLWVKIPGILAAPVLAFALPRWEQRFRFGAATVAIGLVTWLPALVADARVVIESVLLYSGLRVQTTSGGQIWGLQIFYPDLAGLPEALREPGRALIRGYYRWNTWICVIPIVLFAWLRRRERSVEGIAFGVTGCFALLYGFSNLWAFQYLAWTLPFWWMAPARFSVAAQLLCTAYIYSLYAWLCGDPLLLGEWDFIGKPDWPAFVRLARSLCVLFFFGAALAFLGSALREERARRLGTASGG
jgi:hypothetical protein